jgi:hypothetical protein
MTDIMVDRVLCGWRLRSDLPLPDFFPWVGDDRQPDVTVHLGQAADWAATPVGDRSLIEVDGVGFGCRGLPPSPSTEAAGAVVSPTVAAPALWRDVLDQWQLPVAGLRRCRAGLGYPSGA